MAELVMLELNARTYTCTNGVTSLIIHANDAFPISSAPNLCTGINHQYRQ